MSGRGRQPVEPPAPELVRRVWIEDLQPAVDGGRHPAKRIVGDEVEVSADILVDGHDRLAGVVRHRPRDEEEWREAPLAHRGNDVWSGAFTVDRIAPWLFTVEAWVDEFASWRDEVAAKHAAGQDIRSELLEGSELVARAAERAGAPDSERLRQVSARLASDEAVQHRLELALGSSLRETMARWPDRSASVRFEPELRLDVERERARFGAWYEMFPRSVGTLREAAGMLPYVAGMGFDVLYLPPIHPIGRRNRKGADNALRAAPGDPGSPWAIGAAEGGHTAVHPGLGTIEDFDAFVAEARRHDLEVALDIAFQCSPDHPWVREHPEWFRHRPDGTIKYAENPPKKYQDIYALDFSCPAWRSLWLELAGVMEFWAARGVRIFRVDNPHTKPLRFWQWAIREVRRRFPDTVFLSEAFTRPKMMYALAKVGFSQSYTYFTWRNTRHELTEYLSELARPEVRDVMRPNFFVNTPDILPEYLQLGGRPAFQVRLVLAATLAASYGVYSGYELLENEAVPGTEEYRGSEKYEIRRRDLQRPDSLQGFISRLNAIRRDNRALHDNDGLRFLPVDNPQLLFYARTTPGLDNVLLVVVNLDPHHAHDGWVEVPIDELGIAPDESYQVHDLLGDGRYLWQGGRNYVHLDPASSPAQIYRLRRRLRSERDFDYYM